MNEMQIARVRARAEKKAVEVAARVPTLYDSLILPRPYLSVSQVKAYMLCPKAYEYSYILNRPRKGNVSLIKGSSEHEVYEVVYQQKIDEVEIFSPKVAGEYGIHRLEENAEKNEVVLNGVEKDTACQEIIREVSEYVDVVVPLYEPLFVEKEWRVTLESGIPFLAYMDLIHIDDVGDEVIADYKISAKKWTLAKAMNELQFQIYSMISGIAKTEVHNVFGALAKRKSKPNEDPEILDLGKQIRVIEVDNSSAPKDHLNMMIERVAQGISMGNFPPCALDSWKCTEKFCDYFQECRGRG